jgi:hypothetical protein
MSNFTPNLRLTQPIAGETGWGDKVNNGITALVESALTGITTVNLTNGDYTLSVASGDADESRSMFLQITGTTTVIRNLICPAVPKLYFARNQTDQQVIVRTQSGLGVTVPPGRAMVLQCNGVDVLPAIDYLPAQSYAHDQSAASASWSIAHSLGKYPSVTVTDSAGDEVEGEVHYDSLNSLTVSFSAPFAGKAYLN